MDDIAKELGISKKTLYQYVENKNDLLLQVVMAISQKHLKDLHAVLSQTLNAIDEMRGISKIVIQELRRIQPTTMYDLQKYYRPIWAQMEQLHQEHIYGIIKTNLEKGIREGLYRQNLNVDIVAKFFVGKTIIVTDEDIFPLKDYNRENLFKEYINYHIRGIASEKGLEVLTSNG